MLAELMRLRYGIAIAGAHGKTTTTAMIAWVLERAGLDPTAVIGGVMRAFGSNARLGRGDYMVVEADESDQSFLKLSPSVAVITNIDREHLENYGSFERLLDAFADFANKVPFYGAVILCADDPHVRSVLPRISRRVIRYALDAREADLTAEDIVLDGLTSRAVVRRRSRGGGAEVLGALTLQVPGRHNLANALAAIAAGLELEVPYGTIAAALAAFRGADRRFQVLGEARGVMVVDDYGHHPTEIAAVVSAARAGLGRRLIVVFQPHRYSRTRALQHEFALALAGADEVVLCDIYAAGEDPLPDVSVERLADEVRQAAPGRVHLVKRVDDLPPAVAALARPGDLVITLGAGSIAAAGPRILAALEARGEEVR
jgi:UDP-N-acetylmuramate--alanine ligase